MKNPILILHRLKWQYKYSMSQNTLAECDAALYWKSKFWGKKWKICPFDFYVIFILQNGEIVFPLGKINVKR